MTMTPEIVGIGEAMLELRAEGPLSQATTFHNGTGGDVLNALVAAARLGSKTGFITRVGTDPFTGFLLRAWQQEGVDVSQCRQVDGFNGLYFISQLPGGERDFVYYRAGSAASTLIPEELDRNYIRSAEVLLLSGITQAISASARETTLRAARIAHEVDTLVAYDPNLRLKLWETWPGSPVQNAREAFDEILPYVDLCLISAGTEITTLLGVTEPPAAIEQLWLSGVPIVAVKAGAAGAYLGDAELDEITPLPALAGVPAVDSSGAGDAFNGAFLHGLLSDLEPLDAARLAVVAAGLSAGRPGAIAAYPTRAEVYGRLG